MTETDKFIIPPEKMVFIPLGGSSELGMNLFAYGFKNKWIIIDCGIGFPDENLPGIEALLPDPAFLSDKKKDILGLFITHAHEDHIGAIPYLWRSLNCPIYASAFAKELIECKLNEVGLLGRVSVNTIQNEDSICVDPFEVECIAMTHSLPQAMALAIRTSAGLVVHTGDWKLNKTDTLCEKMDTTKLKELGKEGVLAMICDSTNVLGKAHTNTEEDVRDTLTKLVKKYKGRQIAVGCFASNVARLESICHSALMNGLKVCLLGRSLWRIDAAARACGYLKNIPEFLSEEEALEMPIGSVLYICTGSQGEAHSALRNLAALQPSKNAVSFTENDVVIFSSRVITGNEKAIAFLQKKLKSKGIKIITSEEELVHVSGHYSGDDLKKMYQLLKPMIALPVHGDTRELLAHTEMALKWGAKFAFALEEGEVLALDKTPQILGEVPVGILAVDGKQVIPLNASVIKKRKKMIDTRPLVATLVIDKKGKLLSAPQITAFGLLEDVSGRLEELTNQVTQDIEQTDTKNLQNDEFIINLTKNSIRKFIDEYYGKKALIEVHLVRI